MVRTPSQAAHWAVMTFVFGPTGCMDFEIKPQEEATLPGEETGALDSAGPSDTGPHKDTEPPDSAALEPDIEVDPTAYDAGEVAVGETISTTIAIHNVGEATLTLTGLSSTWTMDPDLSDTTIAAGDAVDLTVSTIAEDGGAKDALLIESDDPDEPSTVVPLSYSSTDPCTWNAWIPDDSTTGGWGGTQADGQVELSGDVTVTATVLTQAVSGTVLSVESVDGFGTDDEIFVLDTDGRHDMLRVVATAKNTLEVDESVTFGVGARVQRVHHYTDVTVTAEASASVLVFRACGTVTLEADLSVSGGGYAGGQQTTAIPEVGWQGQSEIGAGTQSHLANGTGGGGGEESCNVHADGGGGGHATEGEQGGDRSSYHCGGVGGEGGGTIGDTTLATIHLGGGAGSGYLDDDAGAGSFGGQGGAGGGIISIVSREGITGKGTIVADGQNGEDGYYADNGASPGGGGGGAGGTVWLVGDVAVDISAVGGTGGTGSEAGGHLTVGGTGGEGRIRIDGVFTATANPAAYESML